MSALASLVQFELGPARDDFFAESDEGLDKVTQGEHFGTAAADRQHVGREAGLCRRIAPDLVEHDFRRGIPLEIDDDAHTFTR